MKNHYFISKQLNSFMPTKVLSQITKTLGFLSILAVFVVVFLPQKSQAQVITIDGVDISNFPKITTKIEISKEVKENEKASAVITSQKPTHVVNMVITAYTSHVAQTDDTPCITASGLDVCKRGAEDIVATNFNWLPFGTKIKIPELFGDRIFIVHDRMNARYSQRVDVWMKSYADAVKFGKRYATVEIYN